MAFCKPSGSAKSTYANPLRLSISTFSSPPNTFSASSINGSVMPCDGLACLRKACLLVASGTGREGVDRAVGAAGAAEVEAVAGACAFAGPGVARVAAGSDGGARDAAGPLGVVGACAFCDFFNIWGAGVAGALPCVCDFASPEAALLFVVSAKEALNALRSARVGRSFFCDACAALSAGGAGLCAVGASLGFCSAAGADFA